MKAVWNQRALEEFERAIRHLHEHNPDAAVKVADAVLAAVDLLLDGRFDGPPVELTDGRCVLHWWVHPFHVLYIRHEGAIRILRVYHHSRRPLWKP